MTTVSLEFARQLIDFAPDERSRHAAFGESQLKGAVAAWNMLETNQVAYLADEVGMGKTYVALGVVGLLRHLEPGARFAIIAPRENIQQKWIKELQNFVRNNWLVDDGRVRDLRGGPVRQPAVIHSVPDLARSFLVSPNTDPVLRMTSFSIWASDPASRKRLRKRLLPHFPWADKSLLPLADRHGPLFRDNVGRLLNAALPPLDLLIVDEGHNLKHGFGENTSIRNRVLGLMLGHPSGHASDFPNYGSRARRLLVLSATPFEEDWADIWRQLDVLGSGDSRLRNPDGSDPRPASQLTDPARTDREKKELAKRFVIRRVAHLNIGGKPHSKNMYRREWRKGGYAQHDEPLELTDPRQRLTVALVQKKVLETLDGRRFNNSFQIGMLSSFESFLESQVRREQKELLIRDRTDPCEIDEPPPVFDGDQDATLDERDGADRSTVAGLVASYREHFGEGLPHPKLDATTEALASAFTTGEKALVFVRRVATVGELVAKLNRIHDEALHTRMRQALPDLQVDVDRLFQLYESERSNGDEGEPQEGAQADDEGGRNNFFAWFFRGNPTGLLSGGAFRANRLESDSARDSTFFEDDYVAWLLDDPDDSVDALARLGGLERSELVPRLRRRAWAWYRERTTQHTKLRRRYIFESWQVAGLAFLSELGGEKGVRASTVLLRRFETSGPPLLDEEPPSAFGGPDGYLDEETFPVLLAGRPDLRAALWPEETDGDFPRRFQMRELRREFLSGLCRLGAPYIDLYLLAIQRRGTFRLGRVTDLDSGEADELPALFLDLLQEQSRQPGFHAFAELAAVARNFGLLLAVNFPGLLNEPLSSAARILGNTLRQQEPAGGMWGGVNKRMVAQFRLPGFPLVLVTTDVLQEGEDLHTFCRNVIHYGITWTPSAMEQRTGRIDRIGGLAQRRLDGREQPALADEKIQVYFPHLRDTIEVLQVRSVLRRLNRFIEMAHEDASTPAVTAGSRINLDQLHLHQLQEIPRITRLLQSAFPVTDSWLTGRLGAEAVNKIDTESLEDHLEKLWTYLDGEFHLREVPTGSRRRRVGIVQIDDGQLTQEAADHHRRQIFELELRSQSTGSATLIRCTSPIGELDLEIGGNVDLLAELQETHSGARIAARRGRHAHQWLLTIETDRLFALATSQPEELRDLVERTALAADAIENVLFDHDAPVEGWEQERTTSDD